MGKSNKVKSDFLGMPYGTACNRLKKAIMFDLIKKLGKNTCYRCNQKIESVDELSIEHKKDWLGVDQDLFWNIDNITFSHFLCNSRATRSRGPKPYTGPKGTEWCTGCKKFVSTDNFGVNKKSNRTRIYRYKCNDCRKRDKWGNKSRMKNNGFKETDSSR